MKSYRVNKSGYDFCSYRQEAIDLFQHITETRQEEKVIIDFAGITFISRCFADEFYNIVPWSKGGPTTADNCQMLCSACNAKKANN